MKCTWGRHKERRLEQLLKEFSTVSFLYRKVSDGTLRLATGTRQTPQLEKRDRLPKGKSKTDKTVPYMDTTLNPPQWRSFRRGQLVQITSYH